MIKFLVSAILINTADSALPIFGLLTITKDDAPEFVLLIVKLLSWYCKKKWVNGLCNSRSRKTESDKLKKIVIFCNNHCTLYLANSTQRFVLSKWDYWVKLRRNPGGIYFLKVNNRNTRTRCEICSMASFWCLYC